MKGTDDRPVTLKSTEELLVPNIDLVISMRDLVGQIDPPSYLRSISFSSPSTPASTHEIMGDQHNISQILAALAAHQSTNVAGHTSSPQQGHMPLNAFSGSYHPSAASANVANYSLPPPDSTGSLDISGIKPVNTGSVSIADAIAKARGIAAEKGILHDQNRDSRRDPRSYHRSQSPQRSPSRITRDIFRDNYNPYRDERRTDRRAGPNERGYTRDRSFSPRPAGRAQEPYSPQSSPRQYWGTDDRPPPQGRRPGSMDDNVETISVESSLVGLIIGRQGESLRRIESDTGTRIQFLDNADPSSSVRLCKITGSRVARGDVKAEITRIISESSASRSGTRTDRPGHMPPKATSQSAQDDEDAVRIMVPDRTVGLIIGRGGETIRDLQERSGCHVNIVNENKSINGLRPVNLIGSPDATERAKNLILEIVESDTRQLANPTQREPRAAYGGDQPGGGPGGEKINDMMFIPPDAVGMIIGKGGDTIKEMQAVTGCRINIQSPVGRDADREVTLVGSRGAIEEAKRMIMEKIDSAEYKARSQQPQRRDDSYGDRYARPQQRQGQQYYQDYQDQNRAAAQPLTQQHPPQPGAEEDPYAQWGGYQNYIAWWYAAMQQQAQQQQTGQAPPGQSEPPGPPGVP
ncbi:KH domain-containing protein [Histoplasma capsulatum var. duboisii H88]|uniref:KH domain-containing protein n=1 Tax=Ajellomyces capsulatus (strain H88) TaxID=544711 RepID=A0A8A1L9Q3_AJEC8|nr:KH domain-containing protein [Histoplasma capsulatum var. duboisii H88]